MKKLLRLVSLLVIAFTVNTTFAGKVFNAPLGDNKAELAGNAPEGEIENAEFKEVEGIKCLSNGSVKFELPNGFPAKNGTFSIKILPQFKMDSEATQVSVMKISGKSGSMELEYNPAKGMWGLKTNIGGRNDFIKTKAEDIKENQWNHICISWSYVNEKDNRIALYTNGKMSHSRKHPGLMEGAVILEIGGKDVKCCVADIVMLDKYIGSKGVNKLMKGDAAPAKQSMPVTPSNNSVKKKANINPEIADKLKLLKGKFGYVPHHVQKYPKTEIFNGYIEAEIINPADIGKVDLSKYKVLHFPKGPHFQIKPEQYKYIVEYVKNGGGYVGSCQGSYFAAKLKLLDFKTYVNDVWGLFTINLVKDHVITDWRKNESIKMHFGNGPMIIPGKDCEVIAEFDMTMPGNIHPAAIITGQCGKGRVVLFAPHPTGGKVSIKGVKGYFSGKELETDIMMTNALLYAAGIIENKR